MIVFSNMLLIDGLSSAPIKNAYVVVDGRYIKEVGQGPAQFSYAQVVDLQGRTLMPGLTDAHIHLGGPFSFEDAPLLGGPATGWYADNRNRLLDFGITNVRSGGDFESDMIQFRNMIETGELEGPRISICGKAFQPVGGHPAYTVWQSSKDVLTQAVVSPDTEQQAREEVKRQLQMSVDHIKCFLADDNYMDPKLKAPKLDLRILSAVIEQAHRLGHKTMVHCQEPLFALEALSAGADSVEHLICSGHENDPLPKELAHAFIKNNAYLVPTLAAAYYYGFNSSIQNSQARAVHDLYNQGVKLTVGTDAGTPAIPVGESVHKEIELFVRAGIPPMDAIIAATRHGAEIVGCDAFGIIAPGMLADLIIIDGNPLTDITCTKNICLVMKEGRILREKP